MIIACDFDGTVTTGAMGRGIGRNLPNRLAYRIFFLQQLPRYLLVKLGWMDVRVFKTGWAVSMPRLFKHLSQAELTTIFEQAVAEEMWLHRRQKVIDELQQHHAAGHQILLVSGSYEGLIAAFGKRIGAAALGTHLAMQADRCTGKIVEPLNVGQHKVDRLKAYLGDTPLDIAYGDAWDDIPMLDMAEHPIAVYPDDRLREVANQRKWRILES